MWLLWLVLSACSGNEDIAPSPTLSVVEVSLGSVPLALGMSIAASAVGRDEHGNVIATGPVTWASSATNVATVDQSGIVTAAGIGTTSISATAQEKTGTVSVTVQPVVLSVTFNGSDRPKVGDVYPFSVTEKLPDGSILNLPVAYSIASGPATVSTSGEVRTTGVGAIELRATIASQSYAHSLSSYDWQSGTSSTSVYATLSADAPITDRLGASIYPLLFVGCSMGSFVMFVSVPDFKIADGLVSYQIGSNPVQNEQWRFDAPSIPIISHNGPPLTTMSTQTFVESIAKADKFSLTFNEAMAGAHTIQFRTTGMAAAIAPALALRSCQVGSSTEPEPGAR